MTEAAKSQDLSVELLDLADYPMPFMEEPGSPRYNPHRQPEPRVKKWLDKLNEADGYIVVTPEYNRGMPGVLKNAIDYLDWQLERKPVALVSHGSTGGALAASHIREAVRQLGGINVPDVVTVNGAHAMFDDEGHISPEAAASPYGPQAALTRLFDGLTWWATTLKAGREQPAAV